MSNFDVVDRAKHGLDIPLHLKDWILDRECDLVSNFTVLATTPEHVCIRYESGRLAWLNFHQFREDVQEA